MAERRGLNGMQKGLHCSSLEVVLWQRMARLLTAQMIRHWQ